MERLIIFVKNPLPGKVKTRLGRSIGLEKAAAIYSKLLIHTRNLCAALPLSKEVWYADFIHPEDLWNRGSFSKRKQGPGSLGTRMKRAFNRAFAEGYQKVLLIGSDCPELSPEHLQAALNALDRHAVVLGPAHDGGYYLIGMREPFPLFENIEWSTEKVLEQTLNLCQQLRLNPYLLPTLSDLDDLEDLKKFPAYDAQD